ncbi:MAG: DJ-1/PfpI family protein [Lachnospiraceae bacterium]
MSKVGVFLAAGFEEIEALTVVDLLRRAEIETDVISIEEELLVTGSHRISVKADMRLWEADFDQMDMLVLPGGMPGTKNLEACEPLMKQVELFHQQKKYISAICAAPRILGERGMLQDRRACSFPDAESYLSGAIVTKQEVEVSEHITTARGMGCSIPFALAIVSRLQGEAAAQTLAQKIVFRQKLPS